MSFLGRMKLLRDRDKEVKKEQKCVNWERKTDKEPMVISRCCSVGSELALFRLAVCRLDKVRTES